MRHRFTAKDWRTAHSALHGGAAPANCPHCNRTGFYAPREDHPERAGKPYRSCTFCGFWQDVGKEAGRAERYECHGHVGIRPPGVGWQCPTCDRSLTPSHGSPWPVDDPNHRWRLVPQQLTQAEYVTYWRLEWGHDATPFGIV